MSEHSFSYDDISDDDIKALAEIERRMDSGAIQYVVNEGERLAVPEDVMQELGLVTGQSASDFIVRRILQKNIAYCEAQLSIDKARSNS